MTLFDAPEPLSSMGNRVSTTIAPQALALMNNPQVRQWAEAFANRLKGKSFEDAVRSAYEIALARNPTAEELSESIKFLQEQSEAYKGSDSALEDFCQSLLCLNEFVYVE
jgi:hypothetical protein